MISLLPKTCASYYLVGTYFIQTSGLIESSHWKKANFSLIWFSQAKLTLDKYEGNLKEPRDDETTGHIGANGEAVCHEIYV